MWQNYQEINAINALISIDNLNLYRGQRRNCHKTVDEIFQVLRQKRSPALPPFLPLRIQYQNQKLVYSPIPHSRQSYLRLLNRKRRYFENNQRLIDEYNRRRLMRRRAVFP